MNSNESHPIESRSNRNPCYDIDALHLIALGVTADDGRNHLFPYAQFLGAELSANPTLEDQPGAAPQRLCLRFASAQVMILGSGLHRLEAEIQTGSLKFARPIARNHPSALQTTIHSISVTLEDNL